MESNGVNVTVGQNVTVNGSEVVVAEPEASNPRSSHVQVMYPSGRVLSCHPMEISHE